MSDPKKDLDRAALRELLLTFSSDDLDAFCSDYFHRVKKRFSSGWSDTKKITQLLASDEAQAILPRLKEWRPDAVKSFLEERGRALTGTLEELEERLAAAAAAGKDTAEIEREIIELKRKNRRGREVHAGDSLGSKGRYRLQELLGQGGFGSVWKAFDKTQRRLVAIKTLHGQWARDRSYIERFKRGAFQMRKLRHPAIVEAIEDPQEEGGLHYFVMAYIGGEDFGRAVLEGGLPSDRALSVVLQIGEALQYAHEQGVLHRDVKPANILLDSAQRAYLTDFDLAWAKGTTGGTRTGAMGTLLYASPEARKDASKLSPAADVYSLGVTAVFALLGQDPDAEIAWDSEVVIERLPVSAPLQRVLVKATQRRPEDRFGSMADFCQALRAAIDAKDDSPPPLLYLAYSRHDETLADELLRHLAVFEWQGLARVRHDRMLNAGSDLREGQRTMLREAKYVVCLLSTDFLVSDILDHEEVRRALRRGRLLPIHVRACQWQLSRLKSARILPTGSDEAITQWSNRDAAWYRVTRDIYDLLSGSTAKGQVDPDGGEAAEQEPEWSPTVPLEGGPRYSHDGERSRPRVFTLAASEDEKMKRELHLRLKFLERAGLVSLAREYDFDRPRDEYTMSQIAEADVILPLFSAYFFVDRYLGAEVMREIFAQNRRRGAVMCPILARPVLLPDWLPKGLPRLPSNGTPLSLWPNRDDAWDQVLRDLRTALGMAAEDEPVVTPSAADVPEPTDPEPGSVSSVSAKQWRVSVLYSEHDNNWQDALVAHLSILTRSRCVSIRWFPAGQPLNPDEVTSWSDVVLVLLSASFLAVDEESQWQLFSELASGRHNDRLWFLSAELRPCHVSGSPLALARSLTEPDGPLSSYPDKDLGITTVVQKLRQILDLP